MRALITGYSGFVGPYLAQRLIERGWEAHGVVLTPDFQPPRFQREALQVVETTVCDLARAEQIRAVLERVRPSLIFHLAGQSHVPTSWKRPAEVMTNNLIGSINLFQALKRVCPDARAINISTGEVYDVADPADLPLTESSPVRPRNPYSVSKLAQEQMATLLGEKNRLSIITMRPFNHTGAGQDVRFACPAFARQLARIRLGLDEPVLRVGNLDGQRDFLDVRDVAEAYCLAAEKGRPGAVYNVASGVGRTMRSLLDALISLAGVKVTTRNDPALYRTMETPAVYADASALRADTGWAPGISIEDTLQGLFHYHLAEEAGQ